MFPHDFPSAQHFATSSHTVASWRRCVMLAFWWGVPLAFPYASFVYYYIYIYSYSYMFIYSYTYACISISLSLYLYLSLYIHIYIYIYVYTLYIYIYMYRYIFLIAGPRPLRPVPAAPRRLPSLLRSDLR